MVYYYQIQTLYKYSENYGKKNSAKMSIKNENKNLHRKNNKNA
jgi:hypothetical protein